MLGWSAPFFCLRSIRSCVFLKVGKDPHINIRFVAYTTDFELFDRTHSRLLSIDHSQRKVCWLSWPWLLCGKFWEAPVNKSGPRLSVQRKSCAFCCGPACPWVHQCTFAWAAIKLCKEDVVTAGPISGLEKRSSDTENGLGSQALRYAERRPLGRCKWTSPSDMQPTNMRFDPESLNYCNPQNGVEGLNHVQRQQFLSWPLWDVWIQRTECSLWSNLEIFLVLLKCWIWVGASRVGTHSHLGMGGIERQFDALILKLAGHLLHWSIHPAFRVPIVSTHRLYQLSSNH